MSRVEGELKNEGLLDPGKVQELYDGFSKLVEERGETDKFYSCRYPFGIKIRSFITGLDVAGDCCGLNLKRRESKNPWRKRLVIGIDQMIEGYRVSLIVDPDGYVQFVYTNSPPPGDSKGRQPTNKDLESYLKVLHLVQEMV